MFKRLPFIFLFLIAAALKVHAADLEPAREDFPHVSRDATLMGTEVAVLVATKHPKEANRAIDAALREIKRIEDSMTDWRESPLERINRSAGVESRTLDDETLFVLQEAQKISEITGGTFDITYAGVGKLWGNFVTPRDSIPSPKEIKEALGLVGYKKIVIDAEKHTVFLPQKNMRIGLGGIAKGYAVDRAAQILRTQGFNDFAIKAGGDMIVHGKRGGELWWVSIRHPREKNKSIALLPISNAAISTSGDYERFFMYKGKRYAHIIDPRTGYPVDHTESVTLIGKNAYYTDGLAKGVFVLGPKKGMQLIEDLPDVEGMIVDAKGKIHLSRGLQKAAPSADEAVGALAK